MQLLIVRMLDIFLLKPTPAAFPVIISWHQYKHLGGLLEPDLKSEKCLCLLFVLHLIAEWN
jgi:hypothetical protein